MTQVFISYSHVDTPQANEITAILEELGIDYFRDVRNIEWGEDIPEKVRDALKKSSAILVIISPASFKSDWVPYEIGFGTAMDHRILPFFTHSSIDVPGYLSGIKRLTSIDDLRDFFTNKWNSLPSPNSMTIKEQPDVRIVSQPAIARDHQGNTVVIVSISIQNHSDIAVFISRIGIHLNNDHDRQVINDGLTGMPIGKPRIEPGQSTTICLLKNTFENYLDLIEKPFAVDEIGRMYEGDAEELRKAVNELYK